ncbi:hypothetical protein quinque_008384 [Culex quinquefasciatus]
MSRSATIIGFCVLLLALESCAISGRRVSELFKTRIDNRVLWRHHRLRQLRELTTLGGPTSQSKSALPGNDDQLQSFAESQNGTTSGRSKQSAEESESAEYPEMVLSESDLAEAGVGQHRLIMNRREIYEQNVVFRFYHGGQLTKTTSLNQKTALISDSQCTPGEKYAIIVHGWHENCYETPWITELEKNLNTFRGGCIICMDYSIFSNNGYTYLFRRFNDISEVLLKFMRTMQYEGMMFENLYMFGFSFGGQLVLDAGNQIGSSMIEAIDTCDMAGPGFDKDRFFKNVNFRYAAKNVQCIHTSTDKGTKLMNKCHQDWRMGQCGFKQPAAGKPPFGSHGLCPIFYNLAFTVDFLAESKPSECNLLRDPFAAYPIGYKMGYTENRKATVRGELYAQTTNQYPYNMFHNL